MIKDKLYYSLNCYVAGEDRKEREARHEMRARGFRMYRMYKRRQLVEDIVVGLKFFGLAVLGYIFIVLYFIVLG